MNRIINKFLLAGDKFMPKMYLRQPGFTYTFSCRLFDKKKKEFQNLKKLQIHDLKRAR